MPECYLGEIYLSQIIALTARLRVVMLPGTVEVTVTRTELRDDWAPVHVPTK